MTTNAITVGNDPVAAWLAGRSPNTLRAYRQALTHFAAWRGLDDRAAAADLVGSGAGHANATVLAYAGSMRDAGLSSATISQRLAAIRSLVKVARIVGAVSWELEVQAPRVVAYRDTRGPGRDGVARMLSTTTDARDRAILRCLFDLALRRGEVASLDLAHVELDAARLWVMGKGRSERVALTLPAPTAAALRVWIAERGDTAGPLFLNRDPAGKGDGRLTGTSIGRIVSAAGIRAGLSRRVRAHGLRHAAITAALDALNGDVRAVQRFSRHASIETLMRYDDARRDDAGAVAAVVAGLA